VHSVQYTTICSSLSLSEILGLLTFIMASNSETDSDVTEALTNVEPDDEWDNNSVCNT
jgi:hypothetical protein